MSEVQGKLIVITEVKEYGVKGFRKRECVIETESEYPQKIQLEFVQDKCDLLNSFKIGQDVTIGYNLNGREWVNPQGETKYFNSIQGWKINSISTQDAATVSQPEAKEHVEDLPF